ncbi:hypothetical protein ON010_g12001 [Phytophthora cinnamomi]|nr:hypothetical protein ON010_g12001 [Phytophthora cinnamomi]
MLGVVMGVILSGFFYHWTDYKRDVLKIFSVAIGVCIAITIYSILTLSGKTGQSRHSVGTTLGFTTIATTIGMYASPMATIVRVIRTKTASSMPFTMGIVNVLNSFCWTIYAALVNNMFIMAPNIAGVVLGSTQMIVTYIYRPKILANIQVVSVSSEDKTPLAVLVFSDQEQSHISALDYGRTEASAHSDVLAAVPECPTRAEEAVAPHGPTSPRMALRGLTLCSSRELQQLVVAGCQAAYKPPPPAGASKPAAMTPPCGAIALSRRRQWDGPSRTVDGRAAWSTTAPFRAPTNPRGHNQNK